VFLDSKWDSYKGTSTWTPYCKLHT